MPNLTVNVTDELLKQSKIYASEHRTTLSNIVRNNLIDLTKINKTILEKYADGSLSSKDAVNSLNLDSKEELFKLVCASGLEIYHIENNLAEKMANNALLLTGLK